MHAIVKTLTLISVAILGTPAIAHQSTTLQPPEGCDGAPADAVLQLPAPVGYWIRIICTDTGHALAPAEGDAWTIHQDSRSTGIAASQDPASGPNDWYFVKAAVKEATGTDADWAQQLFEQRAGFPVPAGVRQTEALDLTDNRGNMIRAYIFVGADGPTAGVACMHSCETSVTVTVTHPEAGTPME